MRPCLKVINMSHPLKCGVDQCYAIKMLFFTQLRTFVSFCSFFMQLFFFLLQLFLFFAYRAYFVFSFAVNLFLVVFLLRKNYLMSSLAMSVRPSSVEISLERGCTITNRPIDLKFGLSIGGREMHV